MTTTTTETTVLVTLEPATRVQLEAERQTLLGRTLPDRLTTAEEYESLAADQARVQSFIKRVEPEFDEVCDAAHKTWKRATALRSLFFEGLHADTKLDDMQRHAIAFANRTTAVSAAT